MAEYIEREAVLQKKTRMTEYDEGGWGANVSVVRIEDINAIPAADVVEVVRCRECVALYRENERFKQHCCRTGALVEDDDFCSYGERRDTDG